MHFATFAGSADEAWEPLERLALALREEGRELGWRKEGGFGAVDVGECVLLQVDRVRGGTEEGDQKERVEEGHTGEVETQEPTEQGPLS